MWYRVIALLLIPVISDLDSIIILTRHGVRSQFVREGVCDPAEYTDGSIKFVPPKDWGTEKPGMLTPHGFDAVKRMGEFQSKRYVNALELSPVDSQTCSQKDKNALFIYTDQDQRDIETARAFFRGFHMTCSDWVINNMENNEEKIKPIIDQGAHVLAPECDLGTEEEVRGRWQDLDSLKRLLKPQFEKLAETTGCCSESVCDRLSSPSRKEGQCTFLDIGWEWEKAWFNTFKGPLYCAKWYSEWFLLTYLNGMEFAGGKLTDEELLWLSVFVTKNRELEFDIIAARAHASTLLGHIVMSLEQRVTGKSVKGLDHPQSTKLLYYGAHDTNVLYIKELLGLSWLSEGWQKDHTPPGGHITFELYKEANKFYVALFFDVQKPIQIRKASKLTEDNKPSRNPLTIPGCSMPDSGEHALWCPWETFKEIALRAINPTCVFPREEAEGVAHYVNKEIEALNTVVGYTSGMLILWVVLAAGGSATIVSVVCGLCDLGKSETYDWSGDGLGKHSRLPTEDRGATTGSTTLI